MRGDSVYRGNGEAREFPIPKGTSAESIIFSIGGRCAILMPGEGYEIRDDSIVFNEPPPDGATISFSSPFGTYTSADAVNKITEGISQITALLETARSFVLSAERIMSDGVDEAIKRYDDILNKKTEYVLKEYRSAIDTAHDDLSATIANEKTTLDNTLSDTNERLARAEMLKAEVAEQAESALRSLRNGIDTIAAKRDKCESLIARADAVANEAKAVTESGIEAIRKETSDGIDAVESVFIKESRRVSELEQKASSISSRLAEIQDRGGRVIG